MSALWPIFTWPLRLMLEDVWNHTYLQTDRTFTAALWGGIALLLVSLVDLLLVELGRRRPRWATLVFSGSERVGLPALLVLLTTGLFGSAWNVLLADAAIVASGYAKVRIMADVHAETLATVSRQGMFAVAAVMAGASVTYLVH